MTVLIHSPNCDARQFSFNFSFAEVSTLCQQFPSGVCQYIMETDALILGVARKSLQPTRHHDDHGEFCISRFRDQETENWARCLSYGYVSILTFLVPVQGTGGDVISLAPVQVPSHITQKNPDEISQDVHDFTPRMTTLLYPIRKHFRVARGGGDHPSIDGDQLKLEEVAVAHVLSIPTEPTQRNDSHAQRS